MKLTEAEELITDNGEKRLHCLHTLASGNILADWLRYRWNIKATDSHYSDATQL